MNKKLAFKGTILVLLMVLGTVVFISQYKDGYTENKDHLEVVDK